MLQNRPSSPEKELLRLIEESKKESSQIHKAAVIRQTKGAFSLNVWRARLSFLKENLFKKKKLSLTYEFSLIWLNRTLIVLVVFLSFYLVNSIIFSLNNLKKLPALETVSFQVKGNVADFMEKAILKKSASYYLEKVSQRDIFNMEERKNQISIAKPSSGLAEEAFKSLRLVGISWSENPDAMIEDSRAMRTFFVKTGQVIGDFKVKAIFKDRVILLYNNEEFELR